MGKIAVLCVQYGSVYTRLDWSSERLELFDKCRNAFSFTGDYPVIAHPPCRLWGKLKGLANPDDPFLEKELGRFCVRKVIENGGVLEHPFDSGLFKEMGLPLGGTENELGFTLEMPQRWFGHSMIKNTWLFFSRIELASLPELRPVIPGSPRKAIELLSKKQREATPVLLAEWLVRAAQLVK